MIDDVVPKLRSDNEANRQARAARLEQNRDPEIPAGLLTRLDRIGQYEERRVRLKRARTWDSYGVEPKTRRYRDRDTAGEEET